MQNIRHYNAALNGWGMETINSFMTVLLSGSKPIDVWMIIRYEELRKMMKRYGGIGKEIDALSFLSRIILFWAAKWFIAGVSIWMLCAFWYIVSFYML